MRGRLRHLMRNAIALTAAIVVTIIVIAAIFWD